MRKHIVMIMEPEKADNDQIKEFLEPEYIVIQAFNEDDAVKVILNVRDSIEVVLMDHRLLSAIGSEKIECVKKRIFSYGIPIISTLDGYDLSTAAKAIDSGAADILIRPYEKTVLCRRVHNMVLRNELKAARQYDDLTDVYTKESFYQKAEALIIDNPDLVYTIICLDLERFKVINDLFGSLEGDRLLQHVGSKLKVGTVEAGGVAGRIASDIFACCYPSIEAKSALIAEQITDIFKGYPLNMEIRVSIGFYHVKDRTLPISRMCDRAILALNSVKGNYVKNFAVYSDELRNNLIVEQEIVNDMEYALKNEEFKVYLQPKCDMDTGKIVGAEALVRWQHPEKGMISPGEFIPIFEENNFIVKLDNYMWEKVCAILRSWIDAGYTPVPISVNVSRVNLYNDDLYSRLVMMVEKYRIDPRLLELEITESAYSRNLQYLTEVVERLHTYGFTILMDDFGSGYSSLNMLKDINVNVLKMDMRFLTGETNGQDRGGEILESVVRMAKWLNLFVIAEGVETKEQVNFLLSINCHYAQGFHYYKPMPVQQFEELLGDENKTDYRGLRRKMGVTFNIHELMHPDAMSNVLLQNIIGGVAFYHYYDGNLELIRVNEGYYAETGCSEEEIHVYAKNISDMIYEEDRHIFDQMVREASRYQESGVEGVFRRRRLGGEPLRLHMRLFFLAENHGKKVFYASLRNVTEEKQAEEQQRISEERLRLAMQNSTNFLIDVDIKKRTIDYDESDAARLNLPNHFDNIPEGLIESGAIYPDDHSIILQTYGAILQGAPTATCEIRAFLKDGKICWLRVTLTTVLDKNKAPIRAVGLIENIAKEKALEQRLKQQDKDSFEALDHENQSTVNRLMSDLFDGGMIGGYCEENFPLYFISQKLLDMLGYKSQEDFKQHTGGLMSGTVHPDDLPRVLRAWGADCKEGYEYTIKYRMLRKDGSNFGVLDKGRVVKAENEKLAIVSVCLAASNMEVSQEY